MCEMQRSFGIIFARLYHTTRVYSEYGGDAGAQAPENETMGETVAGEETPLSWSTAGKG